MERSGWSGGFGRLWGARISYGWQVRWGRGGGGEEGLVLVFSVPLVQAGWNVMAHAQGKRERISSFARNGRVHLNRRGGGVSSVDCYAAEVCASTVVMLDTPCSEVVWRVLATHSIRQFPLHFPSRTSPCAITFQLGSNTFFSTRRKLWNVRFVWAPSFLWEKGLVFHC